MPEASLLRDHHATAICDGQAAVGDGVDGCPRTPCRWTGATGPVDEVFGEGPAEPPSRRWTPVRPSSSGGSGPCGAGAAVLPVPSHGSAAARLWAGRWAAPRARPPWPSIASPARTHKSTALSSMGKRSASLSVARPRAFELRQARSCGVLGAPKRGGLRIPRSSRPLGSLARRGRPAGARWLRAGPAPPVTLRGRPEEGGSAELLPGHMNLRKTQVTGHWTCPNRGELAKAASSGPMALAPRASTP